jgi:hypothetical protein
MPVFKEFTMIGSVSVRWEEDIGDPVKLILDASISINKAIIEIVCESNLFGTDNYDGHVDMKANYLAKSVINCYGFAKGMYLRAVLESVVKPNGTKYNIQADRANLEPLATAFHTDSDGSIDINQVLPTILKNPAVFMALKDIVEAIPAYESLVNCARSIEGIRQAMAPTSDRKVGWKMLRDNLNLSQDFLGFVTDSSIRPRHGDPLDIPFSVINESIRRSWMVMNRFLEFKKRGDQNLPLSEFPFL